MNSAESSLKSSAQHAKMKFPPTRLFYSKLTELIRIRYNITKLSILIHLESYSKHLKISWIVQSAHSGHLQHAKIKFPQTLSFYSKLPKLFRIRYNITKLSILIHLESYLKHLKFSWIVQRAHSGHLHNMQNRNISRQIYHSGEKKNDK